MVRYLTLALVLAAAAVPIVSDAAARDGATIVDSGSTNTMGYRIELWSDGSATVVMQNRAGQAQSAAKPFSIGTDVTARFFSDLKAVHGANVTGAPCMKSASFGTSTHVTWHGWTSPDLDCPAQNELVAALVRDVNAIRSASGIGNMPGLRHGASGGPLRAQTPAPSASPSKR